MKDLSIPPLKIKMAEYASQGNAILGIKGAGKSYAATYIAEQLMDAGVPIIAFDPIGIWSNLKIPGHGKGYPIVVAHPDRGDLPLTPKSAPEIVRAAMKENISLIVDLYSMRLSKRDWRDIVESCIRILLYENKSLRHVFIEEASEFAPQRVQPDQGRVYAEIEKLARMGGNASLGYTLINQRSEELNKAVLEICDCLLLFRQKGRNSLTALGKWLDFSDKELSTEIIQTLPSLPAGKCWIWPQGTDLPKQCQVPIKQSFHPDRRQSSAPSNQKPVNVSEFVLQLSESLKIVVEEAKENDPEELRKKIRELEAQIANAAPVEKSVFTAEDGHRFEQLGKSLEWASSRIDSAKQLVSGHQVLNHVRSGQFETLKIVKRQIAPKAPAKLSEPNNFGRCERAIMTALAQYPSGRTISQLAVLSGYSSNSGGFKNSLAKLRMSECITRGQTAELTAIGLQTLGDFTPLPTGRRLQDYWMSKLGKCEATLLAVLLDNRTGVECCDLAQASGYSPDSGGFKNALSRLRTLELMTRGWPAKPSDHLFQ